ncbi:MAG TPA: hypothetical protein VFM02_03265 [Candidatus Paceibacterota bacterium]|nr:hypothetical protein [Candidatus Paceibacterota bacterium]
MDYKIKLSLTALLLFFLFLCVFPEVIFLLGVPQFFPFVWQTALIFYAFEVLIFLVLAILWPQRFRLWKIFVLFFLLFSFLVIFSTPEFTGGGWALNDLDREGVIWFHSISFVVISLVFGVWSFIEVFLSRRTQLKNNLGRKKFLVNIIPVAVTFLLVLALSFIFGFDSYGDFAYVLFLSLIGGILLLHLFYFAYLCGLRLSDSGHSKKWLILLTIPLIPVFILPPFGVLLSIFLSPFYLLVIIILGILPKSNNNFRKMT